MQALLHFFWTPNKENMNTLFELTREHRCQDPWLSIVLSQARHGTMTQEVWSFLHGFPTLHPGSWDPNTNSCKCGNALCQTLSRTWEKEVQHRNTVATGTSANRWSAASARRNVLAAASLPAALRSAQNHITPNFCKLLSCTA